MVLAFGSDTPFMNVLGGNTNPLLDFFRGPFSLLSQSRRGGVYRGCSFRAVTRN